MRLSFEEIRNRKLIRWAAAYVAASWLLLQVVQFLSSVYSWPGIILRILPVALAFGLLAVVVLAWFHGEKGAQRVTAVELGLLTAILFIGGTAIYAVRGKVRAANAESVAQGSIAVLPFEDVSPKKDQTYFSDGLSDELRNLLAQIPQLRVAARTSSSSFRDMKVSLDSIAKALRVEYILEGTVRSAGDKVRISATLSDAKTGYQVWTSSYDRDIKDVFAVQEEIGQSITDALRLKITGQARVPRGAETKSVEAHDLVLRGQYALAQARRETYDSARNYFTKAIASDSAYAPAWSGLATLNFYTAYRRFGDRRQHYAIAEKQAQHALELNPESSEAEMVLARVDDVYRWDFKAAKKHFARSVQLDPSNARAFGLYAWLTMRLGDPQRSIEIAKRALDIDPVSSAALNNLAAMYFYAGQWEKAVDMMRLSLAGGHVRVTGYGNMSFLFGSAGQADSALHYAELAQKVGPQESVALCVMGYAHALLGHRAEADGYIAQLRGQADVSNYLIAVVYVGLGRKDDAFRELNEALSVREDYAGDMGVDPVLRPLHADPRFNSLLRHAGLPVLRHL